MFEAVSGRWSPLVVMALKGGGKRRHGKLRRELGGVSQKMLIQTLRQLEMNGLVERGVHPVVSPKVEYSLTLLGRSVQPLLEAICQWSERRLPEVEEARLRADPFDCGGDVRSPRARRTDAGSRTAAAIGLWNAVYLERVVAALLAWGGGSTGRVSSAPLTARKGARHAHRRLPVGPGRLAGVQARRSERLHLPFREPGEPGGVTQQMDDHARRPP